MLKRTYRIRNWSEYNASLKQRGSLEIWISSERSDIQRKRKNMIGRLCGRGRQAHKWSGVGNALFIR